MEPSLLAQRHLFPRTLSLPLTMSASDYPAQLQSPYLRPRPLTPRQQTPLPNSLTNPNAAPTPLTRTPQLRQGETRTRDSLLMTMYIITYPLNNFSYIFGHLDRREIPFEYQSKLLLRNSTRLAMKWISLTFHNQARKHISDPSILQF